jgi:DNA-binding beta-propeller fold protein YncE
MRKLTALKLLIVVGVLAGAALGTLALAGGASKTHLPNGTIWLTERTPGLSTVAAIDARTGTPLGITSVGELPIGITAPRGLDKVYSSDEASHQMSVIDKDMVSVIRTIPMGPGSGPHHLMATRNGRYIYVGEYHHDKVGLVDTRLDQNVADFQASHVAGAKTHAVWITRHRRSLYATNEGPVQTGPGTLSKLDGRTGAFIWEVVVGNRPSEVLVARGRAYVSVRNDDVIRVYDVRGSQPVQIGEAEAQSRPDTLSLTNDKRTLIVGLRGTPARMAFIDTRSLTTEYLALPGGTTGHQWLSRDSRFTFIALETPGAIGVVDNRTRSLVTTYPYPNGLTRPHGLFFEPGHRHHEGH